MYWIFTTQAAADAAQQIAADLLPDDTLANGQEAPVQITTRWADVLMLIDGRFAFVAKPGMAIPAGAAALDDILALLPPPATLP